MSAPREQRMWTLKERHFVRDNYQKLGYRIIAARLDRSTGSVRRMATKLRVTSKPHSPHKWTEARKRRFADLYRRSPETAAGEFGIKLDSAYHYAVAFGVRIRRRWEEWEDDLLIELYPQHKDSEIIRRTGRTKSAVVTRAKKMGLRRPAVHEWTKWRFKESRNPLSHPRPPVRTAGNPH